MVNSKHMRPQNSTRILTISGVNAEEYRLSDLFKDGPNGRVTRFRDVLIENISEPGDNRIKVCVVPDDYEFPNDGEHGPFHDREFEHDYQSIWVQDSTDIGPGELLALDSVNTERTWVAFAADEVLIRITGTPV